MIAIAGILALHHRFRHIESRAIPSVTGLQLFVWVSSSYHRAVPCHRYDQFSAHIFGQALTPAMKAEITLAGAHTLGRLAVITINIWAASKAFTVGNRRYLLHSQSLSLFECLGLKPVPVKAYDRNEQLPFKKMDSAA
jgi:hypothetical protein